MHNIEMTGKSISEAVEAGAKALELGLTDIEYKVLDEGSKGFLGIGARPVKVLVWKTGTEFEFEEKKEEPKAEPKVEPKKEVKAEVKAEPKVEPKKEVKVEMPKTEPKVEVKAEPVVADNASDNASADDDEQLSERASLTDADKADILSIATNFLKEVFGKMNMEVVLDAKFNDNKQISIVMSGEDMGAIIGKRGQTLDSLLYLTNLVVNKGEYPYMNVTLDTEDYRVRRKETLERLAFNLAKKAKHNGRNVTLEPMNPYERRIIHATLQNDRFVTTYSEGVEPYRYVVIALKNGYSARRKSYSRDSKEIKSEVE